MSTSHYDDRDPERRRAAISRTLDLITAFSANGHKTSEDELARLLGENDPGMTINVIAALAAICAGYIEADAERKGVTVLDEIQRLEELLNGGHGTESGTGHARSSPICHPPSRQPIGGKPMAPVHPNYAQKLIEAATDTPKGKKLELTLYVYPDGHGNVIVEGANLPVANEEEGAQLLEHAWRGLVG